MDLTAIPEIRVESAGDEVTYWLPARRLGAIRWLGLIPVGFSAIWLSGVGGILLVVVRQFSSRQQPGGEYFMAAFLAFLLVFVVAGCIPLGVGFLVMFGRCRVRWRDGRLTVWETLGLLAWRRRLPRAVIAKFTLITGASYNGQPVTTGPLSTLATLVTEFEGAKPRFVAVGYPQHWLEAVATDLSGRVGSSQPARPQVEVKNLTQVPACGSHPAPRQFRDMDKKPANLAIQLIVILIVAMNVALFCFFGRGHGRTAGKSAPAAMMNKSSEPNSPGPLIPGLAFSSFGPSNTYGSNTWAAGTEAHADWFVSTASGPLTAIQLAIEPNRHARDPGNATVSIAQDERGFPGATLETFSVPAGEVVEPVILQSVTEPVLKAGVKYWMCVKSTGLWRWHFNNRNITRNSAREISPGKWASAGDYCYVCAFSVTVSTNR
jgi:hypothetical protein